MSIGKEAMRQARGVLIKTTLAISLLAAKPLSDLDHTSRVIAAAWGKEVSCYDPGYAEQDIYRYDAIAVPGGGVHVSPEGYVVPSEFEQIRLEAAATAYIHGFAPRVILLDGTMDPQVDPFIDRTFLQDEVKSLSGGTILLPDHSVILETHSINTATNMRALSKLAAQYNMDTILLVTNRFHIARAEIFACAYGNNAHPWAAEDIIIRFDPGRAVDFDRLGQSPSMEGIAIKETAEIAVSLYDPEGIIPTFAKQFLHTP